MLWKRVKIISSINSADKIRKSDWSRNKA